MTKFMGINGIARPENRLALKPTQSSFLTGSACGDSLAWANMAII